MNPPPEITLTVLGVVVFLILVEALFYRRLRNKKYDVQEAMTSFGIAVGQKTVNAIIQGSILFIAIQVADFRLFTISMNSIFSWAALFFLNEFIYYWMHRCSHKIEWFWASHSVHHSMHQLVLSSAYRLGWTAGLSGVWIFFMTLIWIGFPVKAVFLMQGISLLYQFGLHTELVPSLGFLEYIFNTPSNHRVHHAKNEIYLDKNFGGVLVIFDHVFGTYQKEKPEEICEFGIVGEKSSRNIFKVAFREWVRLFQEVRNAPSVSKSLAIAFGPPIKKKNIALRRLRGKISFDLNLVKTRK